MDLFICTDVFLPLRSTPSHRAEMVSEILFGERFRILESSGTWIKIMSEFDSYEGWIDGSHGGYSRFNETGSGVITGRELLCELENESQMILAPGSELFNLSDDYSTFSISDRKYRISGASSGSLASEYSIEETALHFLNTPYLWGGRTPWGIDCSGFVQVTFKIQGVALPRDASMQAEHGMMINFFEETCPGDLLFFSGENENISHTGIMISPGKIIHASGSIRIDAVDHQGIWDNKLGKYTHRLRLIRRVEQ